MHHGHTWSPVTLSVLDLQLDDARDADCENSLHAFGQSEKRSRVQCITIIPIRGISPRTRWYASLPINSSFQTQIRLCIKTSNQKVLQMFERWEWNLGKTHLLLFLEYIAESWNWFIVFKFASLCSLFQISISFYLGSSIFLTLFNLKSDENRIVSHDAIFYVHDATSKLSAGAIIEDGDRKRAPFLVLGLAPWYGTIFLFLEQIAPSPAAHARTCCEDFFANVAQGKWHPRFTKFMLLAHNSARLCLLEFGLSIFVLSCSSSEVRRVEFRYVPLYHRPSGPLLLLQELHITPL